MLGINVVYLEMAAIVVLLSAVGGFLIKYYLDHSRSSMEITRIEYFIALAVIGVILVPMSVFAGSELARNNLKSFNENINTAITEVSVVRTICTRDGSCRHTYDCDRYTCYYSCDSDGDGESDDTCSKDCYHRCPYCTEEWNLYIHTDADSWTGRNPLIAASLLPQNADAEYRWRAYQPVPPHLLNSYGQIPSFYTEALNNLQYGTEAQPFVIRRKYESYTLAANVDDPTQWQDEIELLKSSGLMPVLQTTVDVRGLAQRVYFVGMSVTDPTSWYVAHNHMSTAFGNTRQGDLHIVIINKQGVDISMESMLNAIKYNWQDSSLYGDNTFAKNGVLVILETLDNQTVSRAGLITGMPEETFSLQYNDDLRLAVHERFLNSGEPLTPDSIIGRVVTPFMPHTAPCDFFNCTRALAPPVFENGVLTELVFGLNNQELAFQRISMSAKDPDDVGPGFVDLDELIIPTPMQRFWIVFVSLIVSSFAWVAVALAGERWGSHYWR